MVLSCRGTARRRAVAPLELESCLACRVAQGLDASVVLEPAPVEDDLRDAGGLGLLSDGLAHDGRGGGVPGLVELHALVVGGGGRQRLALEAVDHLGIDVVEGLVDREARALLRSADALADADAAAGAAGLLVGVLVHSCCSRARPADGPRHPWGLGSELLALLALDDLVGVLDALA